MVREKNEVIKAGAWGRTSWSREWELGSCQKKGSWSSDQMDMEAVLYLCGGAGSGSS